MDLQLCQEEMRKDVDPRHVHEVSNPLLEACPYIKLEPDINEMLALHGTLEDRGFNKGRLATRLA